MRRNLSVGVRFVIAVACGIGSLAVVRGVVEPWYVSCVRGAALILVLLVIASMVFPKTFSRIAPRHDLWALMAAVMFTLARWRWASGMREAHSDASSAAWDALESSVMAARVAFGIFALLGIVALMFEARSLLRHRRLAKN